MKELFKCSFLFLLGFSFSFAIAKKSSFLSKKLTPIQPTEFIETSNHEKSEISHKGLSQNVRPAIAPPQRHRSFYANNTSQNQNSTEINNQGEPQATYEELAKEQKPVAPPAKKLSQVARSNSKIKNPPLNKSFSNSKFDIDNLDNNLNRNHKEQKDNIAPDDKNSNSITSNQRMLQETGSEKPPSLGQTTYHIVNSPESENHIIPQDFNSEGLVQIKGMLDQDLISESEFLSYIDLGLAHEDEEFRNEAISNLVQHRSAYGLLILGQIIHNADESSINLIQNAIVQSYKTTDDIKFIAQMIRKKNESIQMTALQILEITLNEGNIDLQNHPIQSIFTEDIFPSLNSMDNGHPSSDLAKSLAQQIHNLIS